MESFLFVFVFSLHSMGTTGAGFSRDTPKEWIFFSSTELRKGMGQAWERQGGRVSGVYSFHGWRAWLDYYCLRCSCVWVAGAVRVYGRRV